MAKFCGKCGSRLDEATGLCPNCDADILGIQEEKLEIAEIPKPKKNTESNAKKPLSKKEAKKQRKADKKAAKKAKKKEKWTRLTFGQKIRRIFLRVLLWLIGVMILAVGMIGGLLYFNVVEIPMVTAYQEGKLLEAINEENIIIEESGLEMVSGTEGIATIIVKMPNYELLFKEAATTGNPELYLFSALALKNYEIQRIETTASVAVENGKTVIHSDDAVHQLLEKALIDAINALSEVE